MILANRYKLEEQIGKGSFGVIYKGKNIRTNELIAIKIESIENTKRALKNEAKLYQYLGNIEGFVNIKWFGIYNKHTYMVMDLLGESLTKYKQKTSIDIIQNQIKNISMQMIKRIEVLHKHGLIHRDIKPDNFIFGLSYKEEILYLIDLGMCKNHLLFIKKEINGKTNDIIGTPIYVSLFVNKNGQPSRRDDIESVLYILLYLMDKLEWIYLIENNSENINKIIKYKENIIYNYNISLIIIDLIIYCRNLEFNECPDYTFIYSKLELL